MQPLPAAKPNRLSPRQRIRTALAHRQPDRVPFTWGFGPTPEMGRTLTTELAAQGLDWATLRDVTCDKVGVGPAYTGRMLSPAGGSLGMWGIHVQQAAYAGGHYEEFTNFPLAGCASLAELDRYPWPDPAAHDLAPLRARAEAALASGRAVQVQGGNPFEIYTWMTGVEEALLNLATQPELVSHALGHIGGFMRERLVHLLGEIGDLVDIVMFADDLGGQKGLLLSRATYRAFIQPTHAMLTRTVRDLAPNAVSMYHSDGAVFDILPELLDAGVQVLEAVQTDAQGMEPARLKAAFGDRLAFHGAISVQHLLPHGDAAEVYEECRRIVAILGANGGYIAAPSHAIQVGTPVANVLAMLRAVLGPDDFAEALAAAAR